MLIIDDRICFVHMHKCGGTSVCRAIIENVEPERLTFYGYTKEGEERSSESRKNDGVWKHSTALEIKERLGDDYWNKLEKRVFLSTRDPWERVASFFFYAKRHFERDPSKYPFIEDMSFTDFVLEAKFPKETILKFIQDNKGNRLVDELIDFNHLEEQTIELLSKYGIEIPKVEKLNANPHTIDYRQLYGSREKRFVTMFFQREINRLGFKF